MSKIQVQLKNMSEESNQNPEFAALPGNFIKRGFKFDCWKRQGNVALYKRQRVGSDVNKDIELIRIARHNGYPIAKGTANEIFIQPAEMYPGATSWGVMGKTFLANEEERALKEFNNWVEKFSEEVIEVNPGEEKEVKVKKKGRIAKNVVFNFPNHPFTVKELAEIHNVSTGYINLRLPDLIKNKVIELFESKKVGNNRGRKTNFFQLVEK